MTEIIMTPHENTQIPAPPEGTAMDTFDAVTLYLESVGPGSSEGTTLPSILLSFRQLETLILSYAGTPEIKMAALDLAGRCFTRYATTLCQPLSDTLESARKLHAAKDADYGDSFGQTVRHYGLIAALTRLADKANRLAALVSINASPQVASESILDTLIDTANYSAMLAALLDTWAPRMDTLADTVGPMLSDSPRQRLAAEATQLRIRLDRLKAAIHDGTLALHVPEHLIYEQAALMSRLLGILDTRLASYTEH